MSGMIAYIRSKNLRRPRVMIDLGGSVGSCSAAESGGRAGVSVYA
jgi:hypothetical protein